MKRTGAAALERLRVLDLIAQEISQSVLDLYTRVAAEPEAGFHFPTGRAAAEQVGYRAEDLARVPPEALARFAGVGCPLRYADLAPGERVLDVGCGAGTDLALAAHRVGPSGHVAGVDLTPSMVAATRAMLAAQGLSHVDVREARAPRLPRYDAPFDVVTSNGALNLVPEKERTLARIHDALRPGGRLVLSDIVLQRAPSVACQRDATLWAECLVGAFTETDYLAALAASGFVDVTVHAQHDYFARSSSAETRATARELGASAWVLTARRA